MSKFRVLVRAQIGLFMIRLTLLLLCCTGGRAATILVRKIGCFRRNEKQILLVDLLIAVLPCLEDSLWES